MAPEQPQLIAILRGMTPAEAPALADALLEGGITCLEVPLNSPDPLRSIERLRAHLGDRAEVGAGTVTDPADVPRVAAAGGTLVVAPDTHPAVITAALESGLTPYPGVATASEVFTALRAGARHLKIFPAPAVGTGALEAWRAVVPEGTAFLPVGGISAQTIDPWLAAGAAGAGLGTWLYRPGDAPELVAARAAEVVEAARSAPEDRASS